MSKEKEKTEINFSVLGSLPVVLWVLMCIGEPDLLDALIKYVNSLSEVCK